MKGQKPFIQLENKKVLLSLVREVQKLAARFIWTRRRTVFDVDDLVQESMIKILTTEKPKHSGNGWLYAVVRNTATDFKRRVRTQKRYEIDTPEMSDNPELYDKLDIVDDRTVQRYDSCKYEQHVLDEVIEELPDAAKVTLLLFSEGYSYQEIADTTETGIGTVRSRLYYARKKAKELLINKEQ